MHGTSMSADFLDYDDPMEPGFDPLMAGAAYALYRHGQDRQTEQLASLLNHPQGPTSVNVNVTMTPEDEVKGIAPVNAAKYSKLTVTEWSDYIGQEPMKQQLMVHMDAAKKRGEILPHTLFASGRPGIGKTTMARLIAKAMDGYMIELVPPFNIYTLTAAAEELCDGDFLFIDEIHGLANNGKRGAEILLKVLEDGVAYLPDGSVHELNKITIIGATTDKDKLPETIIDRFKIKPYFQPYSSIELDKITIQFARRHDALMQINSDLVEAIANACRGTPRIAEELVMGTRDLGLHLGRPPTPGELLAFMEVEPDGLTRIHVHYLTALRQYFRRESAEGEIEYIVGEAAITQILRETKQGIGRIERFLIEIGMIDRTPRGRRLTERGIRRAEELIKAGKGASDI